MSRRERYFCDGLVRRVSNGADFGEKTLMLAALESFGFGFMSDEVAEDRALRRAKRLLRRPDIRARISGLFENGHFFVTDAVTEHVKHIRSGNYQALKDYWAMTQGPIPKRVEKVTAHVEFEATREPKPIAARSLTGKNLVLDGKTGEVREAQITKEEVEGEYQAAAERVASVYDDAVAYEKELNAEIEREREDHFTKSGAYEGR